MIHEALDRMSKPHRMQVRRAFMRLEEAERLEVVRLWLRHRRACEKLGCDPDPATLREAIADIRSEMVI